MADNILKGIVDIDTRAVGPAVKQVEKGVKDISDRFREAGAAGQSFGKGIEKLPPALKTTTDSLKSTRNANFAFNQVLREAPAFAFSFQTGILGISNNLPILADGFKRAKEAGQSTGQILKGFGAQIFSLTSIISLGSLALIKFGDTLFEGGKASRIMTDATETLTRAIEQQKDSLNDTLAVEKYFTAIDKLRAGAAGAGDKDIFGIDLKGIDTELQKVNNQIRQTELASTKADEKLRRVQAALKGVRFAEINKADLAEFNTQQGLRNQQLLDLEKQRGELIKSRGILVATEEKRQGDEIREQQKKNAEDYKQQLEKNKAAYERYISETISKAKTFAEVYRKTFAITPEFTVFQSRGQQFDIAKKFLDDVSVGNFKFKVPFDFDFAIPPPEDIKESGLDFAYQFRREIQNYFNQPGEKFDLSLFIAKMNENLVTPAQELGKTFATALRGGIESGFASIGEGIGNIVSGKGFGASIVNTIGDLLQQLGKALISYGAIKTGLDKLLGPGGIVIPGAVAIGLGVSAIAFGQIFKNFGGARAFGGPVQSGKTFLVGEKGPELFTPSANGSIIPNNRLSSFGGNGGIGGKVVFQISGNSLIGVLANGGRSQGRLV